MQSIYRGLVSTHFSELDYVIQFVVNSVFLFFAFIILLLTFKYRKRERKMFEDLTEVYELMEQFLEIKIDYRRFNYEIFWKICLQFSIALGTIAFKTLTESEIYKYKSYELPIIEIAALLIRAYLAKSFFYIDLMHFYMKVSQIFIFIMHYFKNNGLFL